jgi:hypothetical protein
VSNGGHIAGVTLAEKRRLHDAERSRKACARNSAPYVCGVMDRRWQRALANSIQFAMRFICRAW